MLSWAENMIGDKFNCRMCTGAPMFWGNEEDAAPEKTGSEKKSGATGSGAPAPSNRPSNANSGGKAGGASGSTAPTNGAAPASAVQQAASAQGSRGRKRFVPRKPHDIRMMVDNWSQYIHPRALEFFPNIDAIRKVLSEVSLRFIECNYYIMCRRS